MDTCTKKREKQGESKYKPFSLEKVEPSKRTQDKAVSHSSQLPLQYGKTVSIILEIMTNFPHITHKLIS